MNSSTFQGHERRAHADTDAYFNAQFEALPVYLEPGRALLGKNPGEMIIAKVGAGVALSIYDKDLHVGAMGYTLLPDEVVKAFPHFDDAPPGLLQKVFAPIDESIGLIKRMGGGKSRIWVRLMGGASLPGDDSDKGTKNAVFVREYVARKGLAVMNEDLGGACVRRVHFFPTTGRAVRVMLRRSEDFHDIRAIENDFQDSSRI